MDISKIGGNVSKVTEYNSTQKKAQDDAAKSDAYEDTYSPSSEKNGKVFTYVNPKNMTNAQLWEKFSEFTGKQVSKQIGTMKAYI